MSPLAHVTSGDTTVLPTRRSSAARQSFRWVTAFYGPGAPANVAVRDVVRIGRDPNADLVIDDAATSREHAIVRADGERIVLEDRGSSNGTYVDGVRVKRVSQLRDGAIVRVGRTLLRVASRAEPWTAPEPSSDLIGGSALAGIRRQISLVGPTSLSILILGETGTGKDVVARLLHGASGRLGPFIPVNCAALSESLVESELFGHARGAFTGAAARKGLFSAAHGGTLFLDEIGELPLSMQPKLLRVLEDGMVRPVGAEKAHTVDVRVITATHRDLAGRVHGGEFRADLFARLATVEVRMPQLCEHPEDLPALVAHLLARAGARGFEVEVEAMEALAIYEWPMNVRELDSVLRNTVLAGGEAITLSSLPSRFDVTRDMTRVPSGGNTLHASGPALRPTGDALRDVLEIALRAHRGNIRRVCKDIGLSRTHVYRLLKRWEIDADSFRERDDDEAQEVQS
jgi:DNA-binding NtrC family response regulator